MSSNIQYIQFEDRVVKRYIKTIPGLLTGYRLDPMRPENRLDWVLQSPESSFRFKKTETGTVELDRINLNYEQEVIELYSQEEVKLFHRLNKAAIERGLLIEYTEQAPQVDTSNFLTDEELKEIATTKQILAFKKKLSLITSVQTLKRIEDAIIDGNRPISFMKILRERRDELTGLNIS